MATKVIGIDCLYSSSLIEVPYSEKVEVGVGSDIIFKDSDGKEEFGVVKYVNKDASDGEKVLSSSRILRHATANDFQRTESHVRQSERALDACKGLVKEFNLDMSVFRAGYSFDGNKVHFMFTADERIDFRDLVKGLAKKLKKQIHLRQIGPRDKAKLIGGYGRCGRALCCSTFLGTLESINMEMVRDQGLEGKGSSKLSGACGKLLCCLKYEIEAYRELRKGLPAVGSVVRLKKTASTPAREGMIIAVDILNQKVKVLFDNNETTVVEAKEIEKEVKPADFSPSF